MTRTLLSALAAAALLAACSSGGGGTLGGPVVGGPDDPTNPNPDPADPGTTNPADPGTTPADPGLPAPPQSGPGSPTSAARTYFIDNVHPKMANCITCHESGASGAPKSMLKDAALTYTSFDTRGYIKPKETSLLVTHRHAGAGVELDGTQLGSVRAWLDLEAKERVGQAAPINIQATIGACMTKAKFDAIGFQNLRTIKRGNENANNCTGCDNAPCRTCHSGGDAGFYMAAGSNIDNQTFPMTQTEKFIGKYIGTNGALPAASNVIATKATATKTGVAYSHPMFTISPTMQTAIDAFVADAITKYNNKTCGTGTDGGTD
jgi:hypothetical protein